MEKTKTSQQLASKVFSSDFVKSLSASGKGHLTELSLTENRRNFLEEVKDELDSIQNSDPANNETLKLQKQLKPIEKQEISKEAFVLIRDLNLGKCSGKLKARVTYKSTTIDNKFWMDLLDEEGNECRMLFEEDPCFEYEDYVKASLIYTIQNFQVKKSFPGSNKQFFLNAINSTEILECKGDKTIPRFKPGRLLTVKELEIISDSSKPIDILVKVVKQSAPQARFIKGEKCYVKDVWLIDPAGDKIKYTLWNEMIKKFDIADGSIVLCRSVKLANNSELRLVSTGDTAFITEGIDLHELWCDLKAKKKAF